MASVSEQLKDRKAAQASGTGTKPRIGRKPTTSATKTEPEPKPADAEVKDEAAEETKKPGRQKVERTPEEEAARAAAKEERKKAAFEKLRDMNQKKKAARKVELGQTLEQTKEELTPGGKGGRIMYSTRASYYGVKCRVEEVFELRGRILVRVTCMTTKGGSDLTEDKYYTRNFSPAFLQDEEVTEEYEPRRGGETKRAQKAVARKERAAKKAAKEAKAKAGEADEDEAELEDLDLEEEDEDVDAELEDEDEDEADDEDEEDEDEDEEDESDAEADDEAEEDSWG